MSETETVSRNSLGAAVWPPGAPFMFGGLVQKKKGSRWRGRVCGWYQTQMTAIGFAVESAYEIGSVQIYPADALMPWTGPSR